MGCAAGRADNDLHGVWIDVGTRCPRSEVNSAGTCVCDCSVGGRWAGSDGGFEPPTCLEWKFRVNFRGGWFGWAAARSVR